MALIFCDGFDKYGGVNTNATNVSALMQQGEWTAVSTSVNSTIVAGLSSTGFAYSTAQSVTSSKTLAASYARLIGGVRFSSTLGSVAGGIQFYDAGTAQCAITFNSAGTFSVRNGTYNGGTVLGTSTASVTANSIHYLEWDITFSNAGAYQLWLDGVSILSGSGDTTATANNSANQFGLASASGSGPTIAWDDLYLFDSTGTVNNAVLLTSPRVETSFPASDSAVQFGFGAATLGSSVSRVVGGYSASANILYLRPVTPIRNCTLSSITLLPGATTASINLRPVIYADNAGSPSGGALLSAGSTVTGMTSGTFLTMPLTTPQSLTAGTQYWIGLMNDVVTGANGYATQDASNAARTVVSTFTSGAPSICPGSMTTGVLTVVVYGNVTSVGANYYEVASVPVQGLQSYLTDTTVNDEDLYNFGALSQMPTTINAVAVKANCSRSDTGARTVSMRMKSGSTDSGGSATGQTPNASGSFGWLTSLFITDPNTSAAWTGTALNAAQSGFKIDS